MPELPELRAAVRASAERRYGPRRRRVRHALAVTTAVAAAAAAMLALPRGDVPPGDEIAATSTPAQPITAPTTGSGFGDRVFPGWTGRDGHYTIVIESTRSQSSAERVAQRLLDAGTTVGILHSDDFSSLNPGYYVVFSGDYSSRRDAEHALDGLRRDHENAYIRQIKA